MRKIYFNGNIITMESKEATVEAVMVHNDEIIKMGNLSDFNERCNCEMIDLDGKTLMPSFIDAHGHISMVAQMSSAVDLGECGTFEEIIAKLKKHQQDNDIGPEGIILGYGYDHNFLPGGAHPTKEYLNQVSTEIPVYVYHASVHMGCGNNVTLAHAKVTAATPDVVGGHYGRISGTMEPNGYFEENAHMMMQEYIDSRIDFNIVEAMDKAQKMYLANGVTTVQDGASVKENVATFVKLADAGHLHVDLISYPLIDANAPEIFSAYPNWVNNYQNHFKLGGYKACLDGSPQGRTAWLSKPYENSGDYCAYPWYEDKKVEEFMATAIRDNQQILVHCNGDAAGDQFLRSYSKALDNSSNPNKHKLRPVMIHCQTARQDQLDLMAQLEIVPSIFVGHVYYWGDIHLNNFGSQRGNAISPVKSAFKRKMKVNFHQDPPVTPPDPLKSVWSAVNRITRNGKLLGAAERCSVFEALQAVTINAAYGYFEEDVKGTITVGKKADLVILDQNPLAIEPEKIKDIKVLETIKDGKVLYRHI